MKFLALRNLNDRWLMDLISLFIPQWDGVVFVGKAQEKCTVYRTEKRHNPKTKRAYAWIVKSASLGMVLSAASPVPNPLLRCFDKPQQEINAWADEARMVA